jgi:uncharacterized protein YjlB
MSQAINPEPEVEAVLLPACNGFPNNAELPLLLYRDAVRDPDPGEIERRLEENAWTGCWRDGVYDFHHFHSNAHEVLVCYGGSARIGFGGPEGITVEVSAGDVAVLPAGTSHKNGGASADFRVLGAYPAGQADYDMKRGNEGRVEELKRAIRAVPLPDNDPIYGAEGPLMVRWPGRSG